MRHQFLLSCFAILLTFQCTWGQELITTAYYPLATIGAGSEMQVADPLYPGESPTADYKVDRRFRLELIYNRNNHSDLKTNSKWTLSIVVNNVSSGQSETLLLEHTPEGNTAKYGAWADFKGNGTSMTWKIASVTIQKWNGSSWVAGTVSDIPVHDIHLEAEVFNDRIVKMSSTPPKLSLVGGKTLSWDYVPGAVEYDVEWVFIHENDDFTYNSSEEQGPFEFKEPVRISTYKHSHTLDIVYPKGTLYFRVRPKGYFFRSNSDREVYYHGAWSYAKKTGSGNMSSIITTDYEGLKTWQYSVVYAENGMSASSIIYYDGSLRARQSLTMMKSTGQVVAAASLYDYEGRQTVQVIPTPVNSGSLAYYNQLHSDAGGNPFDKDDFDLGTSNAMGTTSGAGNYYSPANSYTSDPFRDRIPDAEGYPYSQTVFANDNTGRPRVASGIGKTHRIGGGHESKFYYVKPTERDLRELFGSNVGDVSHYDKTIVIDPNGQASVSYTDQLGRTIATGLMGGAPTSLVPLDNNPAGAGVTTTASLMPANAITTDNNGNLQSVVEYYHMNMGANSITLTYDMLSGSISSVDELFGPEGCASCFYELEISVFDPNGNPVDLAYTSQTIGGSPHATILERYSAASLNCETPFFDPAPALITHAVALSQTGEYRIRKVLRVDAQAVANYIAGNAATLPGAPNLTDISDNYLDNIVTTGCGFDCAAYYEQECREEFGYPVSGTLTEPQRETVDDCISQKCGASISEIENGGDPDADPCSMLLGMLEIDVTPDGWVFEEDDDWASNTGNWQIAYPLSAGGTFTPTSLQDLEDHWEDGWADLLIETHPEYCHYEKCVALADIKSYITELNQVTTWSDAGTGLYINTTNGNFYGSNDPLDSDPLYTTAFGTFISNLNNNYQGTGHNILWFVDDLIANNPDLGEDADGNTLTGADLDNRKWMLMRNLYLGERENFIEDQYTGCPYYDHPSANFVDPATMSDPVVQPYFDTPNQDCAGICNNNVDYWMSRIEEECSSISAQDLQTIQSHLQNYCLTDCDGLANTSGAIQMSDITGLNADLLAVQGVLDTYCTLDLTAFSVDDTCSNAELVVVPDLTLYPQSVVKNLALLTSFMPGGYGNFITTPAITAISGYTSAYPLSHWNSGNMVLRVFDLNTSANVDYDPLDILHITILGDVISSGSVKFDIRVTKTDLSQHDHRINAFSLLQQDLSTWNSFPIDRVDVKQTVSYYACPESYPDFEQEFDLQAWIDDCIDDIEEEAQTLAELDYADQLEDFLNGLAESFSSQCFGTGLSERFSVTYPKREYAYTLYYYDQAGNLVQTVPPQGVHIVPASGFDSQGNWLGTEPLHKMKTMYTYNSLNQLTKSETPDGGVTKFWYNGIQQLRFSQNDEQADASEYSYVKTDAIGRPVEAGVFTEPSLSLLNGGLNNNAYPVAGTTSGTYTLSEVVRTTYHKLTLSLDPALGWAPKDLNNRVAAVAYYATINSSSPTYGSAIFYDYDIHGNVKRLLTDMPEMGSTQRYKTLEYEYDLYSGKMKQVIFQHHQEDQFFHRYAYDDDNRLTAVRTSRDGIEWDEDASYYYYLHGPLARQELGDDKVQGTDYAYTVHGWLKGVNSNTATARRDLGRDGSSTTTKNKWMAQDAFGYSLTYYNNGTTEKDYKPIVAPATTDASWLADNENAILPTTNTNLYNGNIRMMVTAIRKDDNTQLGIVARVYQHDQWQRLKEAQTWTAANVETLNTWTGAASTNAHYSSYEYDLNGNITHLVRRGAAAAMDDMRYVYYANDGGTPYTLPHEKNQLAQVIDASGTDGNFTDDINSGQASDNYQYDGIGRLITDKQEKIAHITWNQINKVTYIQRDAGSTLPDMEFRYDALGRRILKIEYPKDVTGIINTSLVKRTYYALDAAGNVMATYTRTGTSTTYKLQEFQLYGTSRIGTQPVDANLGTTANIGYASETNRASAILQLKLPTFGNGQTVQYRMGSVILNTPYAWNTGATIENNVLNLMNEINRKTVTTDVSASFWWSGNAAGTIYLKLEYSQPGNWNGTPLSTYVNGVVSALNGHVPVRQMGYGTAKGSDIVGAKRYELSNHLGNVLAVISDRKWGVDDGVYNTSTGVKTSSTADGAIDYYLPTIIAYSDYDPFGTIQDGRKGGASDYRYGFQGQEQDDELKGEGNSVNYEYRMHDPRIGRFFAVDPLAPKYPYYTPYQFSGNRPIDCVELEGLEPAKYDEDYFCPTIPKFEYDGSWVDYVTAIDNGVINVLNVIPGLYNSAVMHIQSLNRGTWCEDMGYELYSIWVGTSEGIASANNYMNNTPISQQVSDFGEWLSKPESWEKITSAGISAYFGKFTSTGIVSTRTFSTRASSMYKRLTDKDFRTRYREARNNSQAREAAEIDVSGLPSQGGLDDFFADGVELDGYYDISSNTANFNISYVGNNTNIKDHAFKTLTRKFERMAEENGAGTVNIVFMEVVNKKLRSSKEWAAQYGYTQQYIDNGTGAGTVVWTKEL